MKKELEKVWEKNLNLIIIHIPYKNPGTALWCIIISFTCFKFLEYSHTIESVTIEQEQAQKKIVSGGAFKYFHKRL